MSHYHNHRITAQLVQEHNRDGRPKSGIGAAADLKDESFFATWSTGPEPSAVVFSVGKNDVEKFGKSADDLRDPRTVGVLFTDHGRHNQLEVLILIAVDAEFLASWPGPRQVPRHLPRR